MRILIYGAGNIGCLYAAMLAQSGQGVAILARGDRHDALRDRAPSVMFFGNNASGPEPMISALGRERVLLGFPGAAAIPQDGTTRYVVTSRGEQPTTIGELDGRCSERIEATASALEAAGFPASICANMDAWLKTHVAKILPTGGALFYASTQAGMPSSSQQTTKRSG